MPGPSSARSAWNTTPSSPPSVPWRTGARSPQATWEGYPTITERDIENIRRLRKVLEKPHTVGEMARVLETDPTQAILYLETLVRAGEARCTDLAGPEKRWVIG